MRLRGCGIRRWIPQWTQFKADLSRETAWLDGVRGLAAFLVMCNHFGYEWLSPFVAAPFGAEVLEDSNTDNVWYYAKGTRLWEPWRLPLLRLFVCSGDGQVAIFFVLSGFVLSWGPLKMIRAGNYDKLAQTLGSSVIRRWFRLFLPCIAVSAICMVRRLFATDLGFWTIMKELQAFVVETERWLRPFATGLRLSYFYVNAYNYVMWTIPFEFGGSMFIYITMLSLGRIASYPRRAVVILLISLHANYATYWPFWLFGSGLLLADYVQHAGGFQQLTQQTSRPASALWFMLLVIGIYLIGYELGSDTFTTPGYSWMDHLPVPPQYSQNVKEGRFWWGWGGIFVVASSCHLSFMRSLFETWFIQYLGRISFMLYLIHVLVAIVVGDPLKRHLYNAFAIQEHNSVFDADVLVTTPVLNTAIYATLWLTCTIVSFAAAHFLEIYLDRPCTKVGRIVDDILLNGYPENGWKSRKDEHVSQSAEEERLLGSTEVELGEMSDDIGLREPYFVPR